MNTMTAIERLGQIRSEYMQLLEQSPVREHVLQAYLTNHPILLNPSYKTLHPQFRLGSEYVPDFIIETYDGNYTLVEIEKPTDRLYLNNGDPSSALTHAEQQVLNWQSWVRQNIAYLRYESNLMMNDPEGLVVIGRCSQLNDDEMQKLDERNRSLRGHLQIVPFDALSIRLAQIINNMAA